MIRSENDRSRRNFALRDASIDLPHLPLTGHSGNRCILRDGGAAVPGRPNKCGAGADAAFVNDTAEKL
jgi:hypothetical protein